MGNNELNDEYMSLLNKYIYLYNCYNVNKFGHFRLLLKQRGFRIKKDIRIKKSSLKDFNKVIKDMKDDKEMNTNLDKILKVPEEDKEQYKEYYTNQYLLDQHFNLCHMMNNTISDLKENLCNRQDYNVNKISAIKSKIIYLKQLKNSVQDDPKLENILIDKDICEEERKRLFQEYTIIYGKTNIKDFTDDKNISKSLHSMYSSIFGKNIFEEPKVKKITLNSGKRTNIRLYKINDKYIQKNINLYNYRK